MKKIQYLSHQIPGLVSINKLLFIFLHTWLKVCLTEMWSSKHNACFQMVTFCNAKNIIYIESVWMLNRAHLSKTLMCKTIREEVSEMRNEELALFFFTFIFLYEQFAPWLLQMKTQIMTPKEQPESVLYIMYGVTSIPWKIVKIGGRIHKR